jgi:hypothetical protein
MARSTRAAAFACASFHNWWRSTKEAGLGKRGGIVTGE